MIKTKFIDEEIKYIGSQLAPHWIYKNFHIQGDAIVAFIGECEVKLTEMVDIEDVINNEPIYSKYMLSFISEQFGIGIVEGVLRQRLLIWIYNVNLVSDVQPSDSVVIHVCLYIYPFSDNFSL